MTIRPSLESVCTRLSSNDKSLRELNVAVSCMLESTRLNEVEMILLTNSLSTNTHLERLCISSCLPSDDHNHLIQSFCAKVLSSHPTLKVVILERNNLTAEDATCVADALTKNSNIKELTINNNMIGDTGAKALGEAMCLNKSLEILSLADNEIFSYGAGCRAIASALGATQAGKDSRCPLKVLDLSMNWIGDGGVDALASTGLCNNMSLEVLNVSFNNISDVGCSALAKSLLKNCTLRHLNLCRNLISIVGIDALLSSLEYNYSLEMVDLSFNPPLLLEDEDDVRPHRIRNLCQENQMMKLIFQQFRENAEILPLALWPHALQLVGRTTKSDLIFQALKLRPDLMYQAGSMIGMASSENVKFKPICSCCCIL